MADSEFCIRSSRELWTILLGRSALREPSQIESELERYGERLLQGLAYYKPPSSSSADKLKADKDVPQSLKEFGLRISKLLGLDEQQSVQILQCYLQEDYRGTRNSLKTVLQDERQSQALLLKIVDYYYDERVCLLRCILLLLTYFQDERHPYKGEYATCVNKLEKDLVSNYQQQFEALFNAEAPTWETHGNLMTERRVSLWFSQCLREQALLLEVLFLYYAYFEMPPSDLLTFTRLFKEQGFGQRQTNRHLVDKSMDALVDRIGYFSCLILVEGMDIDFLHKCALEDRTEQHQLFSTQNSNKEMDQSLLTCGDIPHHGPVLLAWVLLRHTLQPVEAGPIIKRLSHTTLQLGVFQYLTDMLKALGSMGNNCTASTARMCIYGLLSFVVTSFEEDTLGSQQHLINVACEVLAAPSLAELFWESKPNVGLEMILDSAVGVFPYKIGPLLQILTALLSEKCTAKRVYMFLDKMSFYTEVYKHKPSDVLSREDETLWRRQTPKLLYPLGTGQTNLRMPQGCYGQVSVSEDGYTVRWDYSYSSWTLFTCEIEMLLHVVSTADVLAHCERVKPILDLVHKIISTDWTVSDCLLPLTSRIYMLLQRLTSVINPPVDVIASCVNCLIVLAARQPGKVWSSLQHTGFLPFASTPLTNMAQTISAEGMKAGNYGNLLVLIEQPRGDYAVTIAFLRLVTTLVKGQVGSTQSRGLIPCVLLVLKEMLPTYHKWRYNTHGVREKIGCLILELVHAILNLCPEGESQGSTPSLQSLCIYSLANTEAGQAVVNIMGVGVDTINTVLAAQPSRWGCVSGVCLSAVRTVQSLACLDEADHTVGFLLQLSSFCKEWHFHLPQLLRDVQVNLCYLCQTCTYLLHSKKMLHHYLQAKNGEALPQMSRPQQALQPVTKEQPSVGERDEMESKALQAVQCSLLKILSKTLATLQHFTPDCCQILLDQSMDLAEYRTLFVLSFTTPAFDSDVAPSFGTLLATINVALSMLGEIEKKKEPVVSSEETQAMKSLLMFSMENCFYVLISQAMRCLKDPTVLPRDKQRVKQELSSELSTLLSTLYRFFRRGSPSSPASGLLPSPQTKPTTPGLKVTQEVQEPFIQLVQAFVRHVQR
ncbi:nucleoporin NUP188 isoform X1 [Tachysurus ichikawai]